MTSDCKQSDEQGSKGKGEEEEEEGRGGRRRGRKRKKKDEEEEEEKQQEIQTFSVVGSLGLDKIFRLSAPSQEDSVKTKQKRPPPPQPHRHTHTLVSLHVLLNPISM